MKNVPIYEALAQAFAAEGVDTHFTLMGDGNMHWASAMKNLDGMASFSANERREDRPDVFTRKAGCEH
jgi:acetolactate synthase-1/2/3 large subunit